MTTIAPDPLERSSSARNAWRRFIKRFSAIMLGTAVVVGVVLSLPSLLTIEIQLTQNNETGIAQFPVTVDPEHKTIVENDAVNALFEQSRSPFAAAVGNAGRIAHDIFDWIALTVADASWYQSLAAATIGDDRIVSITPGMRKEQAASAFAKALQWDASEKRQFMTAAAGSALPLIEGSFSPGIYAVATDMTPAEAQAVVNERFNDTVLDHYGTTTAQIVPLEQALTIASLIEREAGGADDMRIISGIIWNRLFAGMNLQIDATLQYAKANTPATASWWPRVLPTDIYRKSPYNTYLNPGLPPTPIANPSVTSILAALNPVQTSCLFYFHDAARQFHCSDTYAGHVALLKKFYGRGK